MIKCPNCGSTAQINIIIGDNLNFPWIGSLGTVEQVFVCGCCDCEFKRVFQFKETIIIEPESE